MIAAMLTGIIWILGISSLAHLGRAWRTGCMAHASAPNPLLNRIHKRHARMVFGLNGGIVASVGMLKWLAPYEPGNVIFLLTREIHLFAILPFYFPLLLAVEFWLTGERFPRIHGFLAHLLFFFGCAATLSGLFISLSRYM